jgi:hypothetical protein
MIGDAGAILSWCIRLAKAAQLTMKERDLLLKLLHHLYSEEFLRTTPSRKGRHISIEDFYAAAELAILTQREPEKRQHKKIAGKVAASFGWKDTTLLRYKRDHHKEIAALLADPSTDQGGLLEVAQSLHKRSG